MGPLRRRRAGRGGFGLRARHRLFVRLVGRNLLTTRVFCRLALCALRPSLNCRAWGQSPGTVLPKADAAGETSAGKRGAEAAKHLPIRVACCDV